MLIALAIFVVLMLLIAAILAALIKVYGYDSERE